MMTTTTTTTTTTVKSPAPHDVLMGRGAPVSEHRGNSRLRRLVVDRHGDYVRASSRSGKRAVAMDIVSAVYDGGGRFLRRKGTEWEVVEETKQVVNKVKQLLRDMGPEARARRADRKRRRDGPGGKKKRRKRKAGGKGADDDEDEDDDIEGEEDDDIDDDDDDEDDGNDDHEDDDDNDRAHNRAAQQASALQSLQSGSYMNNHQQQGMTGMTGMAYGTNGIGGGMLSNFVSPHAAGGGLGANVGAIGGAAGNVSGLGVAPNVNPPGGTAVGRQQITQPNGNGTLQQQQQQLALQQQILQQQQQHLLQQQQQLAGGNGPDAQQQALMQMLLRNGGLGSVGGAPGIMGGQGGMSTSMVGGNHNNNNGNYNNDNNNYGYSDLEGNAPGTTNVGGGLGNVIGGPQGGNMNNFGGMGNFIAQGGGGGGMNNLGGLAGLGGTGGLNNLGGLGNVGNLNGIAGLGGLGNMGSNRMNMGVMGNLSSLMGMGGGGGDGSLNMTGFLGSNNNNLGNMSSTLNGIFGQSNNMMGISALQNNPQNNFNQEQNKDTSTGAVDPHNKGIGPSNPSELNVGVDKEEESDMSDFDDDDNDDGKPDETSKQQNQAQQQGPTSLLQQLQNSASSLGPAVDYRSLSSFLPNSQMNQPSNFGNIDMNNPLGRRGSIPNHQSLHTNDLNSLARLRQLRGGLSPTSAFESTTHVQGDGNFSDMSALARLRQQLGVGGDGGGGGNLNLSQHVSNQLGQPNQRGSGNLGSIDSLAFLQQQLRESSGGMDTSQSLSNHLSQRGFQGSIDSGNTNSLALLQQQLPGQCQSQQPPNNPGQQGLTGNGFDLNSLELLKKQIGGPNSNDLSSLIRLQQLQGMNANTSSLGGTGNGESNESVSNEGANGFLTESGPMARLQQLQQMLSNNSSGIVEEKSNGGQIAESKTSNEPIGNNNFNDIYSLARLQQLQQLAQNNPPYGGSDMGQQPCATSDNGESNNGSIMNSIGAYHSGGNNFSSSGNANDHSLGASGPNYPDVMDSFPQLQQQFQNSNAGSDLSSMLAKQFSERNSNASSTMNDMNALALLQQQVHGTGAGDASAQQYLGLSNDGGNRSNLSEILQRQLDRDQQGNQSALGSQDNHSVYEKMLQQMGIDVTPKRETISQGSPPVSSSLPAGGGGGGGGGGDHDDRHPSGQRSLQQQMQSVAGANHFLLQRLLSRSCDDAKPAAGDDPKDDDSASDG